MFRNVTPRDANRSRWGVRTIGCPPNPLNCGACSSLMMTRMFGGRVVMRASVCALRVAASSGAGHASPRGYIRASHPQCVVCLHGSGIAWTATVCNQRSMVANGTGGFGVSAIGDALQATQLEGRWPRRRRHHGTTHHRSSMDPGQYQVRERPSSRFLLPGAAQASRLGFSSCIPRARCVTKSWNARRIRRMTCVPLRAPESAEVGPGFDFTVTASPGIRIRTRSRLVKGGGSRPTPALPGDGPGRRLRRSRGRR